MKAKGQLCRAAASSCDVAEYCTGESATCPEDTYLKDGVSCGENLQCASGMCTSRDLQCYNRGYVMNITRSCQSNNEECKLLCNSPTTDRCLVFSGHFIDGTPCGYNGHCFDGECKNGGAVSSGYIWLQEHVPLVTMIVVSSLLFAIVLGTVLFWCVIQRRRNKRKIAAKEYPSLSKVDSNSSSTNLLEASTSVNTP